MGKIVVLAIGGNSLVKDKEHQTVPDQFKAVCETCNYIVDLIKNDYEVIITHGNGPQVGFILLRSEMASSVLHTVPLDSCGADTQGAIGYQIQQALYNKFKTLNINKRAVTIVTQVVVGKNDPAFQNPSKPIGPFYSKGDAEKYKVKKGWDIIEDAGRGYRRVVPSPIPKKIIEIDAIKNLIHSGFVVISVGGGGIPVIEEGEGGKLIGVEAVIDKDYASSLLASEINANLFIISTAIEKVYLNFGKPEQKPIDKMNLKEAEQYIQEGHFAKGSMLPKIKSIVEYLKSGGKKAIITNPENLGRALKGETGTVIVNS